MPQKIGFLGAGMMATAMASGIAKNASISFSLMAADPHRPAVENFIKLCPGAVAASSNEALVKQCDIIVIAVKPQYFASAVRGLGPHFRPGQLIISIMAGISLQQLKEMIQAPGVAFIRSMPNTPLMVGEGATAICATPDCTPSQVQAAEKIFGSSGVCVQVAENLLDAVTGLSASGPAFVAAVIEAMSDAGVLGGIPRPLASKLAAQTVLGTGALILRKGLHPGELKDMVSSPAGTTIHGIQELERYGLRNAVIAAVDRASKRSAELRSKL
jgi:pyrroline-5-carboxylate reductase